MSTKPYCYCGQDLPCPWHGCGVNHSYPTKPTCCGRCNHFPDNCSTCPCHLPSKPTEKVSFPVVEWPDGKEPTPKKAEKCVCDGWDEWESSNSDKCSVHKPNPQPEKEKCEDKHCASNTAFNQFGCTCPTLTPVVEVLAEITRKFANRLAMQLKPSNDTMKAIRLLHKELPTLLTSHREDYRKRIVEEISKHNARILNHFQLQGTPEMPMIAYDERVCLVPAIEAATKETITNLT